MRSGRLNFRQDEDAEEGEETKTEVLVEVFEVLMYRYWYRYRYRDVTTDEGFSSDGDGTSKLDIVAFDLNTPVSTSRAGGKDG